MLVRHRKHLNVLVERLLDQGWRVTLTSSQHLRCAPPDASKPIIVVGCQRDHPRDMRNAIRQLARAGYKP